MAEMLHGFSALGASSSADRLPKPADLERRDTGSQAFVSRRLLVEPQFPIVQEQLFSLFDLIPGLESCETRQNVYSNHACAIIQYSSVASAIYAKQKLHGFEFPSGNRLAVTFTEDGTDQNDFQSERAKHLVISQLSSKIENSNLPLQNLVSVKSQSYSSHLETDAELPSSKKKAPSDSLVEGRLFILFIPHPLPQDILEDVLSDHCGFSILHVTNNVVNDTRTPTELINLLRIVTNVSVEMISQLIF